MNIENFATILQASIAPTVLISGFGVLLLNMTNRLARPVDRTRNLLHELRTAADEYKPLLEKQILILYKRCRFLQTAITFIIISIFLVSIIILMLFSTLVFNIDLSSVIELAFITSLLFLFISLSFFILDIRMTLKSLKLEIDRRISS